VCQIGLPSTASRNILAIRPHRGPPSLHGSPAATLRTLAVGARCKGGPLDGNAGRAAFHHSMNYRSVVVVEAAHPVTDLARSRPPSRPSSSTSCPAGRATRPPSEQEPRHSRPCAELTEASARPAARRATAKLTWARRWAGEIPLQLEPQPPLPDPRSPRHPAAGLRGAPPPAEPGTACPAPPGQHPLSRRDPGGRVSSGASAPPA
jgi:hypothetical protein